MNVFNADLCWQQLRRLTQCNKLLIAYSGGLDSHVLLHSLAQLRAQHPDLQLQAIHVHHGLSANADQWVEFTQRTCQQIQVAYSMRHIAVKSLMRPSLSLEALARQARYKIFAELMSENTCLLTAHTQNDQAETLLLQLFRGAGPNGLAAMPMCRPFAQNVHVRPLLNFKRSALEAYALAEQLIWIEDESNYQLQFDRNYVRHSLMPIIEQRWPSAVHTLARSARHCAEASELLTELSQPELEQLTGLLPNTLSIKKLQCLNAAKQRNAIREWLKRLQFPLPGTLKLQQIITEVFTSRSDAQPQVIWPGVEIRRFQDLLFALQPTSLQQNLPAQLPWDLQKPLILPDNLGTLTATPSPAMTGQSKKIPADLTIRFRQGGESCRPIGRQGTHSLKKLLQEWNIPPWQRHRIPLLFNKNAQLIAVIGYCICEGYLAELGGYEIVWQ